MTSISSAEGVALGGVEGGHLKAAPHAGARPLAHHRLEEEGSGLIVLSLLLLPLVPQARLQVQAGGQRGLGVLQTDGKRRQLQQMILKFTRLFSILSRIYPTCSTAEVMSDGGGRGEQRLNSEQNICQ